jgi:3',5'-cyclic AMP phosphodiesterase CpdA
VRTIVHLSDLHFGRTDPSLLEPLIDAVRRASPDLVAVSGDLTQRARTDEFRQARQFLDRLPSPRIVVPGNHDVPLHNPLARFLTPFEKYRRWISEELEPFHADDEIAVLGVNTARSLTFKSGRVNQAQIARVRERMCEGGKELVRAVVTHHPFDAPVAVPEEGLVGRARRMMEVLAACGADLLLAGHLHVSHTLGTAARYKIAGHSALVVQAGTATSTRGRGELNSFNVIRVARPEIEVERMDWSIGSRGFVSALSSRYRHTAGGWHPAT